jgi:hypothetical protein
MMLSARDARERDHAHVVGFYEDDCDLVESVAEFFADGLEHEGSAVVVATENHRAAIFRALAEHGIPMHSLVDRGRYLALDAERTLATFMRDGRPDRVAFASELGGVVADAASKGRPVLLFGEMVALLWEAANVGAAIELEALWNDLALRHTFALQCAYPASILESSGLAQSKLICDAHSSVVALSATGPGVPDLADGDRQWCTFVPDATELRAVRAFVTETLQAWDVPELREDALLVACELSTNAMLHAASPFRISLARGASELEITVRDASKTRPLRLDADGTRVGGRGVAMIAALSDTWGVRDEVDGKTVWAKLAHN